MRVVTVAVGTLAAVLSLDKLTNITAPSRAATDAHPPKQSEEHHADPSAQIGSAKATGSVSQPETLSQHPQGMSNQATAIAKTTQLPSRFRQLSLPPIPATANADSAQFQNTVAQPTWSPPRPISGATLNAAVDELVTQDVNDFSSTIASTAATSPPAEPEGVQESLDPAPALAKTSAPPTTLLLASASDLSSLGAPLAQPSPDQVPDQSSKLASTSEGTPLAQPSPDQVPDQSSKLASASPTLEPNAEFSSPPPAPSPPVAMDVSAGFSPSVTQEPQKTAALPLEMTREDEYVLGGGDRVRVDVFGVSEYSGEYQVLVNGTVNLPLIGSVSVDGMTLRQASSTIADRYTPLLKRSIVTVNLLKARSLRVAVSGEVNRPGSYPLTIEGDKFPSITRILQVAGGITRAADLRQVQVRRPQQDGSEKLITVNLWDLLQTGNLRQDLVLRDGDSIFIPASVEANLAESPEIAAANIAPDKTQPIRISIVGEVNRPGPRILSKESQDSALGSGQPTVTQAIQQAGGITQLADLRQVQIRRPTRSGAAQTIQVDLWQLLQSGDLQQDVFLQEGDTILVPTVTALSPEEATKVASATFSPSSIKVNIVGEVLKPGVIETPPNTPLNQAILAAGGYNRGARTSPVELIRLNPNGSVSRLTIRTDSSAGANEMSNPMLRNGDIIVVDRSKITKFTDTLNAILTPIGRVLPFLRF